MARVEIPETAARRKGNGALFALGSASVQVNVRDGGAATVYAGPTGTTTLPNPLTTDADGRIEGWVEEGSYDLVVSGALIEPYTQRYEAVKADSTHVIFQASGSGDDTAAWEALVQKLYDLGGGTIRPLGTASNPIVLSEADLLPDVYVDGAGWGASVFKQKTGARWALRETSAEGLPASTTVDDCRVFNVKFDQNGQVGVAFFAEGVKRSSSLTIRVVNVPNSGTWTYDDLSGSGTQTYRSAGIALKGVEGRTGDYYNSLRGFYIGTNHPVTKPNPVPAYAAGTTYGVGDVAFASNNVYRSVVAGNIGHDPATDDGTHWVVVTTTSKFANWQWSASAVYQPGYVAVDTINNRLYVSKTSSNTGHQPSLDDGTNWGLGSWHSANTYAQHNAIMGADALVYVSQQDSNTGHDPTTDDGTWWKLGAAGVMLTSTTETAGQKANDNVIQGVVGGMPYGVLGLDGWDYHVDGAGSDFSNCFVGILRERVARPNQRPLLRVDPDRCLRGAAVPRRAHRREGLVRQHGAGHREPRLPAVLGAAARGPNRLHAVPSGGAADSQLELAADRRAVRVLHAELGGDEPRRLPGRPRQPADHRRRVHVRPARRGAQRRRVPADRPRRQHDDQGRLRERHRHGGGDDRRFAGRQREAHRPDRPVHGVNDVGKWIQVNGAGAAAGR
jgi:hypothetical protein